MKGYENNCVGCEYCVHCGKDHEEITLCDLCGVEISEYRDRTAKKYRRVGYGYEEICETCAAQYADETFKNYPLKDQLMLFDWEKEDFVNDTAAAEAVSGEWDDLTNEEKCEKMVVYNELEEELIWLY